MKTVNCPTCGKPVEWTETSKWRPFCSDRCRLIDLGAWADERYAVAGEDHDPRREREEDLDLMD